MYKISRNAGNSTRTVVCAGVEPDGSCLVHPKGRPATDVHRVSPAQLAVVRKVRDCALKRVHYAHRKLSGGKKTTTQLYVLHIGNGYYKIGCSDDLDKRIRAGRTWVPKIEKTATRTIPEAKTGNWRKYERRIHSKFSANRCAQGGKEVFRLNRQDVGNVVEYMKKMRFGL
jgi:hypothetical protein